MAKQQQKPHVILVYPKTGLDITAAMSPPHGVLAVAAPVHNAGYRVTILDQRVQRITEETLKELISPDLVCVGISTMTGHQINNALNIAKSFRRLTNGAIPIVWGGPHPSVMPEQTLDNEYVDVVVIGEGDETFFEVVKALEGKTSLKTVKGLAYRNDSETVITDPRPLIDVNSLLPTPWDLIDVEKYVHKYNDIYLTDCARVLDLGQTSRGCPFSCGFCSSASIRGRKWRPLSAERSLEMIRDGIRRFNLDGFWLRDDEFYIDRSRAREICEGIIAENLASKFYTAGTRIDVFLKSTHEELVALKGAGAINLKFGAESGSQRILDLMKKGITVEDTLKANKVCMKYGFLPSFTLMIGYPGETFDEINETIDLGYRLKAENPAAHMETITSFTAFPGTPDYQLALDHGLKPPNSLEEWADWTLDDYDDEGRKLPWFSAKERQWIGNISYMSILAESMDGVLASMGTGAKNQLTVAALALISRYFRYRLKNKMYRTVPELKLVRKFREKLFQRIANTA